MDISAHAIHFEQEMKRSYITNHITIKAHGMTQTVKARTKQPMTLNDAIGYIWKKWGESATVINVNN